MPVLRLFASAREAAGVARAELDGETVDELLAAASERYGERFAAVLARSRVWVNGEPATGDTPVTGHDVVAVLPPVSGGAGDTAVLEALVADPPPRPRPVAAPASLPAPAPPPASAPAPVASPREVPPAPAESLPAAPPEPMAGLGGARVPSPPQEAPRDPPVPPPPPVPPRPVPPPRPVAAPERAPEAPHGEPRTDEERPPSEAEAPEWSLSRYAVGSLSRYAVVYDVTRPHGRIGLAWAVVTGIAVLAGEPLLAVWLGLAAFVGATQAAAARRTLDERPPPWLAALVAAGLPAAALSSGPHLLAAVVAGLGAALLARTFVSDPALARDLSVALLIGVAMGGAAGSVVATRALGMNPAFFLLACTAIYDVGAYLIGTGAGAHWEGPAAGMVGIMPVAILASVLLVPPFPAGGPVLLGALAVVTTPVGPFVGTALVGDRELDVPGLRRLDSLIVTGPLWALAATRLVG